MKIEEILELIEEAKSISKSDDSSLEDNSNKDPLKEADIADCSNEHLCSIVASNRYLKINPHMEIICMQELSRRRANGDNFLFENKINEYLSSFTPINSNIPDILSILSSAISGSK